MLDLPGDIGEVIEVGGAELSVGHATWTVTRLRFNRSLKGYLRAHGETSAGETWIPLINPPAWLESLIREVEVVA
jgi:hypothetical protein